MKLAPVTPLVLGLITGCDSATAPLAGDAGDDASLAASAYACHPLQLTADQTCAIAATGRVAACAVDPSGTPSQTGWLEVHRPDGSNRYLCTSGWNATGGFYFSNDREHLQADASACCGGPAAPPAAPVADAYLGTLHAPTHVKPQEMVAATGGDLRQNPFAVVVSSPAVAATLATQLATWNGWAGDGQPHPAPDGSGSYWFPRFVAINYVVIPTAGGDPMIVIAPEPSLDAGFHSPLGHPTLGACPDHGGAPMAYIAGDLRGSILTNGSGRFGHESTVTAEVLDQTARLFDCYGISITGVRYYPPAS